jgi:hypothetical protein
MATVEATTQKVQRILAAKFNNVMLQEDGFAIEQGSTRVNVEVKEFGKDPDGNARSMVHLWAPVGRALKPSADLFHWAATEANAYNFGATAVIESPDGSECFVVFKHTLLGDFLDPDELEAGVAMVAFTADDLDDLVHTKFGGKRYTDA